MALRLIDIADGFSSSAVPSDLQIQASSFSNYASIAAFLSEKGSAASEGDIFFNTTENQALTFLDGEWIPHINDYTKTIDTLVNGDFIPLNTSKGNQTFYVKGATGHVELALKPFGVELPKKGTLITLIGLDDTKSVTVKFEDSDYGLFMTMPVRKISKGQLITFKWVDTLMRFVDAGANF